MEYLRNFEPPSWALGALDAVQSLIQGELPAPLGPFMERAGYALPGRRDFLLRPLLVLTVARHYGAGGDRPVRLAAAVEMIHLASLLHDRLGQTDPAGAGPTGGDAHRKEATDILLGDFLFAKASQLVVEDGDVEIIEDMIRSSAESAEAQARILSLNEGTIPLEPRKCFEAFAKKRILLLSLSLRVGAVLGGAEPHEKEALSEYGSFLGRALRILEDFRFWMDPDQGGIYSVEERALTYPVLLLWEGEGREAWDGVRGEFEASPEGSMAALRARLSEKGYLDASLRDARSMAAEAAGRLQRLARSEERAVLEEVPRSLCESSPDFDKEASP